MINMTKTDECQTTLCYYETATRTNFFHGMLLTDQHLRDEQNYHRDALKRVNRHLWGSGIVCGLTVEVKKMCLTINPGVAIDCCGNLIEVCKCISVDLSKECEKNFGPDCPPKNPQPTGGVSITRYLVLRYMESESDPEPVLTPDADCAPVGGQSKCSASKVREGFCVELWDRCPCAHEDQDQKDLMTTLKEASQPKEPSYGIDPTTGAPRIDHQVQGPAAGGVDYEVCADLPLPCADCGCCESAVALAVLKINCENKTVERQIECKCRRYAITPRLFNWFFSIVKPKAATSDMTKLAARFGERSTANMLLGGMAFEAQNATQDSATAAKARAKLDTTGAQVEALKKNIKTLSADIAALKKLVKEQKASTKTNTSSKTPTTT